MYADPKRWFTANQLYYAALCCYLLLLLLCVLWEGWLAPSSYAPPVVWLSFKSIPLLLPLFGLLHGKTYTYGWASMLILAYFSEGVIVAFSERHQGLSLDGPVPYALAEVVLSLTFVACAAGYIRSSAAGDNHKPE
jgi:uncharacterized membrane protein